MTEKNQERVMYMLNNMADAVCLTNRNGELLYMNPAAKTLFGLDHMSHANQCISQSLLCFSQSQHGETPCILCTYLHLFQNIFSDPLCSEL